MNINTYIYISKQERGRQNWGLACWSDLPILAIQKAFVWSQPLKLKRSWPMSGLLMSFAAMSSRVMAMLGQSACHFQDRTSPISIRCTHLLSPLSAGLLKAGAKQKLQEKGLVSHLCMCSQKTSRNNQTSKRRNLWQPKFRSILVDSQQDPPRLIAPMASLLRPSFMVGIVMAQLSL